MPIYDISCPNCGEIRDIWAKMDEINLPCPICEEATMRLITAPNVIPDIEPYIDYNMAHEGVPISSRQHHRQELKERGLVEWEPFGPKVKGHHKQRWI